MSCGYGARVSIWVSWKLQNSGVRMATGREQRAQARGRRGQRSEKEQEEPPAGPTFLWSCLSPLDAFATIILLLLLIEEGEMGEKKMEGSEKKVLRNRWREIGGKEKALNGLLLWRWESGMKPPREAPSLLAISRNSFMTFASMERRKQAEGNEGLVQGMRCNDLI